MARLVRGQPVTTQGPVIEVDALPEGVHRIQLVVAGPGGQLSEPAFAVVTVRGRIVGPVDPVPGPLRPVPPLRPTPVGPAFVQVDEPEPEPAKKKKEPAVGAVVKRIAKAVKDKSKARKGKK